MKKLISAIIIPFIFLCSCAKSASIGTGFIHASGFDETQNGVRFSVLLEKQESKENKYSCVSFEEKTAEKAFEKFLKEYPDCYTGSAQLCFFGETLSRRSLYECALFLCETPVFPSKSIAVSVSSVTTQEMLEGIKDKDTLGQIKDKCKNDSLNIAAFFALCTNQDTEAKLCSFTLKSQSPELLQPVYYRNCAIMQSHQLK